MLSIPGFRGSYDPGERGVGSRARYFTSRQFLDNMISIATFTVPEDAHLFRTFLESRGIQGFVLDENLVQLFWHYSNAIGGVRVAVDEDDAEEAFTAYQEYMAALREGPYPEEPVRIWPAVALLSLIIGAPFLLFGRRSARGRTPGE